MTFRPRRSVLYMPGANARAMEKAKTLPCDAVILDLEDAVAPDAKARRPGASGGRCERGGLRDPRSDRAYQRPRHGLVDDDVAAIAPAVPDAILIPKVSNPQQLADVAKHLVGIAADQAIRLWAMIETPLGHHQRRRHRGDGSKAQKHASPVFVMGTNDLAKETRASFCRAARRCCHGSPTACSPPTPSASTFSMAFTTTSPTKRAFGANAPKAATWVSTAKP